MRPFAGAGPGALSTRLTVGHYGASGQTRSSFISNSLTIGSPVAFARSRIQARNPGFNNSSKELNQMAVNAYLYVDGVEGPSTSKTGCIDVLSFSWGVSQTAVYGAGASGKEAKAGRADFSNLSIMKVLDKTTPLLADHCATGNILPKVYIVYDKPVGDKQDNYFRIYVKDALITSVQLSGSNENPTESVSFAFQGVEIAYKAENDDGTLAGAVAKGYDLEKLTADYAAADAF